MRIAYFLPGTTGSWTVAGQNYNWFKGLYDGDDLTYNGTNLQPFDEVFRVDGSTLSLVPLAVAVPEPSTIVLLMIGLLAIMPFRRRKRE